MKNFIFTYLVFSCIISGLNAQSSKTEDVLYLRNQWILRGKILKEDSSYIRIQTHEGNTFVFAKDEVIKIANEQAWGGLVYRRKGFANFTELGPLVAGKTTIEGVTTAAVSLQTVNGYKFSQYAMLGIGVGADLYATQTLIPVFISFRGDVSKTGGIIPFYFTDAGYGINITQNSSNGDDFKGGLMYALGLGVKIPFSNRAGFLLSAGYRYQKTSYTQSNTLKEVIYNRIAIRAGFFL